MKIYSEAPDVVKRLAAIAVRYHPVLVDHKLTVGVLMVVEDAEVPQPCLKHQGYDAIAIVSKTHPKHRANGAPDAVIEIDQVRWDELGEFEQDAVLDHELTHLSVVTDEGGRSNRDGAGRPKLNIRLHDHQYGWFHEVAVRYGAASQEVQQYLEHYELRHQEWFAFARERKTPPARKPQKTAKLRKAAQR